MPVNVSELTNDAEYVNETELENVIEEIRLPSQNGCEDTFLHSDGENASWVKLGVKGFELFDTKVVDHVLTYEESAGWALQGTYVYKTAVAGERFGYPDFYAKCLEEKAAGTETEVTLGDSTITMYLNSNGHQFYDIADKAAVDTWFSTYGIADYYGIDTENERVFLPRNSKFVQLTTDTALINKMNEAGLPNHKHYEFSSAVDGTSSDNKTTQQLRNNMQVNSLWYSGYSAYVLARTSSAADVGLSSDAIGDIYGNSDTVQPASSNKLLYYCVGNTVSSTSWMDVVTQVEAGVKDLDDKTAEGLLTLTNTTNNGVATINAAVNNKADIDLSNCTKPYITETYVNGSSWYRLYSDGWCEQGGRGTNNSTVTLLKAYKDTNYTVIATNYTTGSSYGVFKVAINSASTFTVAEYNASNSNNWYACGYTTIS